MNYRLGEWRCVKDATFNKKSVLLGHQDTDEVIFEWSSEGWVNISWLQGAGRYPR